MYAVLTFMCNIKVIFYKQKQGRRRSVWKIIEYIIGDGSAVNTER
jgi:hypothetical protein